MSKQKMLVRSLDEIMAIIRAEIEEIVVEIVEKVSNKELQRKSCEEEEDVGKERKRKRGEEELEEQSSGSEDEDFLSKEAFELMQKTLLNKGFIGERGLKEIIPPFKEIIEKIGWITIYKHLPYGHATIVREFSENLRDKKEHQCYARGMWVPFDRHAINHMCGLGKMSDGAKFRNLKKNLDY